MLWAAVTVVVWGAFTAGDAGAAGRPEPMTRGEVLSALDAAVPRTRTDVMQVAVMLAVAGTDRHGHRLTNDCVATRSVTAAASSHGYAEVVQALRDTGWHPVRREPVKGHLVSGLAKGGWSLTVDASTGTFDRTTQLITLIGVADTC